MLGVFFLLFTFAASGQQATIVGTVTDPSGGAVPKVTITIMHTETGTTRTFMTNEAGAAFRVVVVTDTRGLGIAPSPTVEAAIEFDG